MVRVWLSVKVRFGLGSGIGQTFANCAHARFRSCADRRIARTIDYIVNTNIKLKLSALSSPLANHSFYHNFYDLDLLTVWPENLINTSPGPHTCDLISVQFCSNSYRDIVFTWFVGSLPAVTLIFDLFNPKFNQHIYEPKYICDQNWVKFPSLIFTARRYASAVLAIIVCMSVWRQREVG